MLSADSLYLQGSTHPVCQDYTKTGIHDSNAFAYGVLADGCSSSHDTDIGARLLVLATAQRFQNLQRLCYEDLTEILRKTKRLIECLPVATSCLDTTLLTLSVDLEKKEAQFHITGDGMLLARKRGTPVYDVLRKHFPKNVPWYLSYQLNVERFYALLAAGLQIDYSEGCLDMEKKTWKMLFHDTLEITLDTFNALETFPFHVTHEETFSTENHDLFLMVSDGLESFVDEEKHLVPWEEVLYTLLDFKNFNGDFVKRRLGRAVKEFQKKHWVHEDDLSIAAIYVGE